MSLIRQHIGLLSESITTLPPPPRVLHHLLYSVAGQGDVCCSVAETNVRPLRIALWQVRPEQRCEQREEHQRGDIAEDPFGSRGERC